MATLRNLTVKIVGDQDLIRELVDLLEQHYHVIATSRLLPNREDSNFHCFVNLLPKSSREEVLKA